MENAKNMDEALPALSSQAMIAAGLMELYDRGQIDATTVLKHITELANIVNQGVLRIESAAIKKFAEETGIESLTTDTRGSRSESWFISSGKPFTTGVATNCVVCAVVHPNLGMAASHRNTVRTDDYISFFARALTDKRLRDISMKNPSPYEVMVTPASVAASVEQTINEAFDEFTVLTPKGIPSEGTQIYLGGLDYLNARQLQPMIEAGTQTVRKRIAKDRGPIRGPIRMSLEYGGLGNAVGIIYGGTRHPDYSTPQFYNMN